jgi:hypothetical protein
MLHVSFGNVRNVPALDEFGGLSDPFVKCYFRYGKEGKDVKFYETERQDNVEMASWDQPITFDNYQKGTKQVNVTYSENIYQPALLTYPS